MQILILIEIYRRISKRDGGVLFADSLDQLPFAETFAYRYLPTIVAVIYGMAWAWVDVDAKRMEPYFQLAKPEGALARDSILLSYPYEFLPLVPIKATKNG